MHACMYVYYIQDALNSLERNTYIIIYNGFSYKDIKSAFAYKYLHELSKYICM